MPTYVLFVQNFEEKQKVEEHLALQQLNYRIVYL